MPIKYIIELIIFLDNGALTLAIPRTPICLLSSFADCSPPPLAISKWISAPGWNHAALSFMNVNPLWLLFMIVPCWAVKLAIRYFVIRRRSCPTGPSLIYGFLVKIKSNKAKYSQQYKKLYYIGAPPPCRTDQITLTKSSLLYSCPTQSGTQFYFS